MNAKCEKIFKDPLYNYISVDSDICEKIIDNKYFQRLRRIEQTSMRCLYPSARHDRFIHSLGTYHLGKIAIKALTDNGVVIVNGKGINIDSYISEEERKNLYFSFEMAALLHDIGHSPFSHTLENYFSIYYYKELGNVVDIKIINLLFDTIKKISTELSEKEFEKFSVDCKRANAAPHEIVSCIIVLQCFREVLDQLAQNRSCTIDYCFLCRCILGATHTDSNNNTDYRDCIIKLLNSSIDVDKLDYISRDSQVSGYDNTKIDTNRLLNSLIFALYKESDRYTLRLAFKKTALGVIQNVVISRNSLYTWIYSHHKVKYESYLIETAIDEISKKIEEISKKEDERKLFISKYFSVDNIKNSLVCDDSIWKIFMENIDIPSVNELIERSSRKVAIWKSFAEFEAYFNDEGSSIAIGDFSYYQMQECLKDSEKTILLQKHIDSFNENIKLTLIVNNVKLSNIEHNSILVYINNKLYSFDGIYRELYKESKVPIFFYIYCSKKDKYTLNEDNYKLKNDFIIHIKKFDGFKLAAK